MRKEAIIASSKSSPLFHADVRISKVGSPDLISENATFYQFLTMADLILLNKLSSENLVLIVQA